jgi:hypothetical protein
MIVITGPRRTPAAVEDFPRMMIMMVKSCPNGPVSASDHVLSGRLAGSTNTAEPQPKRWIFLSNAPLHTPLASALERAVGIRTAFVVQAVAFGLIHWRGFPRGLDGVVLATVYGLMLGAIRRRTGGLLAPWLAHVFADVVILALLLAAR